MSRITPLGLTLTFGFALAAQPLSISASFSPQVGTAVANQGGGKGGGGGSGGGHSGGSAGNGASSASNGHSDNGNSASAMGRLNAAHASAAALAHAAPNSAVGRVAAYKSALTANATLSAQDVAAAAAALVALSNKPITLRTVHTLDTRLGLTSLGTEVEQAIVDQARALIASGANRKS
jgi:hypothetical protein